MLGLEYISGSVDEGVRGGIDEGARGCVDEDLSRCVDESMRIIACASVTLAAVAQRGASHLHVSPRHHVVPRLAQRHHPQA